MKRLVPALLFCLLLAPLSALAQEEDYDDSGPTPEQQERAEKLEQERQQRIADADSNLQGVPWTLMVTQGGEQPRLLQQLPRSAGGPWRFIVRCDETTLEQSDTTTEENAWRRITHAVLLVEPAGEWGDHKGASYKITVEQMAVDLARGAFDGVLALPTTDPFKPIPARDGSALYARIIPLFPGTKADLGVRDAGWFRNLRFQPGENMELNYLIDLASVGRFITNACVPVPDQPVGRGSQWTFASNEELDGHPTTVTRTISLTPSPAGAEGMTLTQSFTGTVAQPTRAPAMFNGLTGEPKTFGSSLMGSGESTWGKDCPLPVHATFSWIEDCTGTFAAEATPEAPARELDGRSAARRTDEMHLVDGPLGAFVEEATEEVSDKPTDSTPDAPTVNNMDAILKIAAEPDLTTIPMDLDGADARIEKALADGRAGPPKPETGVEPKRSWLWSPTPNTSQRVHVSVQSSTRECDEIGKPNAEELTIADATLVLAVSDKHDEDGWLTGTLTFETLEYKRTRATGPDEHTTEALTDEERSEIMKRPVSFSIGEAGKLRPSRKELDILSPTVTGMAYTIIDGLAKAVIERPFDEVQTNGGTANTLGEMASRKGTARTHVTFDASDPAGPLHLKDVDLWYTKDGIKFKLWGVPTEATDSERVTFTVRHNIDGEKLVVSDTMALGEIARVRATYKIDGKELVGEELTATQIDVHTLGDIKAEPEGGGEGEDAG